MIRFLEIDADTHAFAFYDPERHTFVTLNRRQVFTDPAQILEGDLPEELPGRLLQLVTGHHAKAATTLIASLDSHHHFVRPT